MSSLPPQQWQRLQSTREDSFTRPDTTRTMSADTGIDPGDKEEQLDPLTLAFRDRYQHFEKTIAAIFRAEQPCCAPSDEALAELENGDTAMPDAGETTNATNAPAPAARVAEDFDFDDEDEDEEPAPPKKTALVIRPSSQPSPQQAESPSKTAGTTAAATREKLEADRKEAEDSAKRAFNTMFFTLENDRDAMLEQQKLEESDRQVNAEANAAQENAPGKLASANLGASSLTLKHLIARIDATREKVKISDMELRNLMSEVRKNRSKWASEEKIGQEELYEAAEKVVLELRAMTEHSTAFLNRVNKREAPDYYQIIKHPMDLGTVMKKLKQHGYKSKKDFVEDLNLIWANCLKYNADPSHFLRKHAKAMQKMTASLVPLIPEITIRDRAEVEAEEAGIVEVDAEGESDDEPIMSTRGRKGPGSKKSRKGAPQAREGTPDVKPPAVNLVRADSNPPGNDFQHSLMNGFPTPSVGGGTPLPNGIGSSMMQMDMEPDDDTGDPEYQAWKKLTKKGRAKIASDRHRLIRGARLNPDEPALLRSRKGMARHIRSMENHLKQLEEDDDDPSKDTAQGDTMLADEDGEEELLVPDYYQPGSSVPELPWRTIWASTDGAEEVEMPDEDLKIAPRGMYVQPKSELANFMNANLRKMQETRKLCSKIAVVKQMQVQTQMYANQFTKYDPAEFVEQDVEEFTVTDDGPVMCSEVSRAAMQRSIAKIFYHAGFEEFQPSALETVTDIATDYFQKLGKTLMLYKEAPRHDADPTPEASGILPSKLTTSHKTDYDRTQEMLLHALYENGADVECLDSYMHDDIERLGSKLHTIHERMKAYLTDLLRPALADTGGDDSKLFNDGSEQFVGGDFAEDIGDDFFGFKELGLDVEFGLSGSSVPFHLLQGRMNNAYRPANAVNNSSVADAHKSPPPYEPLTRELLTSQIGIVKNFFFAKLHANNGEPLIEDEDLPVKQRPPKPRLPPSGKISQPRKRPLQGQGGGSKKKKKPNNLAAPPLSKGVKMERTMSKISEDGNGGMMSPESLVA